MYNLGTFTGGPRDLGPNPLEEQGYNLGTHYKRTTAFISLIMAMIIEDNYRLLKTMIATGIVYQ